MYFQTEYIFNKWNIKAEKISAADIQERSKDFCQIKVYVNTTDNWKQMINDLNYSIADTLEPDHKDRIYKFLISLFKTATENEAKDIIVSCMKKQNF